MTSLRSLTDIAQYHLFWSSVVLQIWDKFFSSYLHETPELKGRQLSATQSTPFVSSYPPLKQFWRLREK